MTCLTVPKSCQHVDARELVEFDWTTYCAAYWREAEVYSLGERVRSANAPGLEFECTTAGQAGAREPKFRTVALDGTIDDGSVVWTARAISDGSLARTIDSSTWEVDSPVTADNDEVDTGAEQKTRARVYGGASGSTYRVRNVVEFSDGTRGVGLADIEFEE